MGRDRRVSRALMRQSLQLITRRQAVVNRCHPVLRPLNSPHRPHPTEEKGKQDLAQWASAGSPRAGTAGASCGYMGAYVWQVSRSDRELSGLLGSCRFVDREVKIQHWVVREFALGVPCANIQCQADREKDRIVCDKVSATFGQKNSWAQRSRRNSLAWRWPTSRCYYLFSESV